MVNDETGKKKEEYAPFYYTLSEKASHPVRIDWQQFWTEKKPKSDLGLEPGLPRRNAIALPPVPPPLPAKLIGSVDASHPAVPGISKIPSVSKFSIAELWETKMLLR